MWIRGYNGTGLGESDNVIRNNLHRRNSLLKKYSSFCLIFFSSIVDIEQITLFISEDGRWPWVHKVILRSDNYHHNSLCRSCWRWDRFDDEHLEHHCSPEVQKVEEESNLPFDLCLDTEWSCVLSEPGPHTVSVLQQWAICRRFTTLLSVTNFLQVSYLSIERFKNSEN